MLEEGLVHLLATDAHDVSRRPPKLRAGRDQAAKRIGELEAEHLVLTRPKGVIRNDAPSSLPLPKGVGDHPQKGETDALDNIQLSVQSNRHDTPGFGGLLRRLVG
jgi:hypothetical protein